jgi:hypothetical protein
MCYTDYILKKGGDAMADEINGLPLDDREEMGMIIDPTTGVPIIFSKAWNEDIPKGLMEKARTLTLNHYAVGHKKVTIILNVK